MALILDFVGHPDSVAFQLRELLASRPPPEAPPEMSLETPPEMSPETPTEMSSETPTETSPEVLPGVSVVIDVGGVGLATLQGLLRSQL